jgi:hypothetical protein
LYRRNGAVDVTLGGRSIQGIHPENGNRPSVKRRRPGAGATAVNSRSQHRAIPRRGLQLARVPLLQAVDARTMATSHRGLTKTEDNPTHGEQVTGGLVAELDAAKIKVITMVRDDGRDVFQALSLYDKSYSELVAHQAPRSFRDFLLIAPSMFLNVGEKIGAISHIVSFWTYRFPPEQSPRVAGDELAAIFEDFRSGFSERSKLLVPPSSRQ